MGWPATTVCCKLNGPITSQGSVRNWSLSVVGSRLKEVSKMHRHSAPMHDMTYDDTARVKYFPLALCMKNTAFYFHGLMNSSVYCYWVFELLQDNWPHITFGIASASMIDGRDIMGHMERKKGVGVLVWRSQHTQGLPATPRHCQTCVPYNASGLHEYCLYFGICPIQAGCHVITTANWV